VSETPPCTRAMCVTAGTSEGRLQKGLFAIGTVRFELTTPAPKGRLQSSNSSKKHLQICYFVSDRCDKSAIQTCTLLARNQAIPDWRLRWTCTGLAQIDAAIRGPASRLPARRKPARAGGAVTGERRRAALSEAGADRGHPDVCGGRGGRCDPAALRACVCAAAVTALGQLEPAGRQDGVPPLQLQRLRPVL
jgi:hypothetical protein